MHDFRLTFMHGQVAGSSAVRFGAEHFARIRPLNELAYAGATATLAREWKHARGRAGVEPRLMVFLANVAAIGVLTVKGMVENLGDPLLYSDERLFDGLARVSRPQRSREGSLPSERIAPAQQIDKAAGSSFRDGPILLFMGQSWVRLSVEPLRLSGDRG